LRIGRASLAALAFAALTGPQVRAETAPLGNTAGSPAQAAWSRYRDTLAQYRERFLASDLARDPVLRAQALYYLQSQEAVAFNMYVASRTNYPAIYKTAFFMPLELSWGMPNPDFRSQNGFIDGGHTYRVWGKVNGIRWATLQVSRGFWGDEAQDTIANVDFDDLPKDRAGNFEIFLGPTPPATAGRYWIRTDPQDRNTWLALREVAYDWQRDTPMEIHIEMLDRKPGAAIYPDEQDLANRIDKARKYLGFNFDFTLAGAHRYRLPDNAAPGGPGKQVGQGPEDRYLVNAFRADSTAASRKQGGNPLGYWVGMMYDVAPEEALIIEMTPIEARYWGFQLGSVWGQTTDYSYHQSSLNSEQARIDKDGKFRAVLSLADPGVPNWLDPAGLATGFALLRFYKSDGIAVPTVTRVRVADLPEHLPSNTPVVLPSQRAASLLERQRSSLRRFGQ
jgi:hypothetical protein